MKRVKIILCIIYNMIFEFIFCIVLLVFISLSFGRICHEGDYDDYD
jgi:hypothetical protein